MPEPDINQRFARYLRDRLREVNDGELPSVSVVTARFNHLDGWQRPVTSESVRRWMRGLSLPELSRLPALCRMLRCTPIDIVDALGLAEEMVAAGEDEGSADEAEAAAKVCEELRLQINQIMRGMDEGRLRAMVALFERRSQPRRERDAAAVAVAVAAVAADEMPE